jgi:hypothetical protein
MIDAACQICGIVGKTAHTEAEEAGIRNHKFSENGELVTTDRRPKAVAQTQAPTVIIRTVDTSLRRLLFQKGVLDDADLASLFNFDLGSARDREAGPAEGT